LYWNFSFIFFNVNQEETILFGWQALADPFFEGLAKIEREPSSQRI
jgi:hypothetical protein